MLCVRYYADILELGMFIGNNFSISYSDIATEFKGYIGVNLHLWPNQFFNACFYSKAQLSLCAFIIFPLPCIHSRMFPHFITTVFIRIIGDCLIVTPKVYFSLRFAYLSERQNWRGDREGVSQRVFCLLIDFPNDPKS